MKNKGAVNRIAGELVVFRNSRLVLWCLAFWVFLVIYNIFSVATILQEDVPGGYYTYEALAQCFIMGIFFPVMVGAFMAGFDTQSKVLDYKLTNQSVKEWFFGKITVTIVINFVSVFAVMVVGLLCDMYANTFSGGIFYNIRLIIVRFFVTVLVWSFWGIVSFCISLGMENVITGIVLPLMIFYGEQYISQFMSIKWGIVKNISNITSKPFNYSNLPFSPQIEYGMGLTKSIVYIGGIMGVCMLLSGCLIKRRYPYK